MLLDLRLGTQNQQVQAETDVRRFCSCRCGAEDLEFWTLVTGASHFPLSYYYLASSKS